MNPGQLRSRVTLLRPSQVRNDCNELVTAYESAGAVWAKVEPLAGGESQKGKQIHADANYLVTIRYNPTVERTWRLRHGSVDLEILSIVDTGTRHVELVLSCKEVR